MSASVKTAQTLAKILVQYLDTTKAQRMLQEMLALKLSNSVEVSLQRVLDEINFLKGNERR